MNTVLNKSKELRYLGKYTLIKKKLLGKFGSSLEEIKLRLMPYTMYQDKLQKDDLDKKHLIIHLISKLDKQGRNHLL